MALMDSVFVVWHVSHVYVLDPSDSHVAGVSFNGPVVVCLRNRLTVFQLFYYM